MTTQYKIYGYDVTNRLIAVSDVTGNLGRFLEEDLFTDQGKELLREALITAGDKRKNLIHRTLVSISN